MWTGVDRFPAPGVTGPIPPGFGLREMEQKQTMRTKILSDSVPFVGFCEETGREQTRDRVVDAITRRFRGSRFGVDGITEEDWKNVYFAMIVPVTFH